MSLPINGRIAIIDDQISHAGPLINILSQKQLPHCYYSGEEIFLPQENDNYNDIRILFLDINLIDDREYENKVLKGRLLPVLNRVISKKNHPYVIIYWSRHEDHKNLIEEEIFNQELSDRKPIAFLSASKSDFFNYDGTPTDEFEEKIATLFERIDTAIDVHSAFNYLLDWENQIHESGDRTLEDVFSSINPFPDWTSNANYILTKLGASYSGKIYNSLSAENKIKSSTNALNIIFNDTIEHLSNTSKISNAKTLTLPIGKNINGIGLINRKLLTSTETLPTSFSGTVIEDDLRNHKEIFEKDLFNNILNIKKLEEIIKSENPGISKSQISKKISLRREEIRTDWKKILLITTPLCDFVQMKFKYNRIVKGLMIKSEYLSYIDDKSEAIFISPSFNYKNHDYIIILHFKFFFTLEKFPPNNKLKAIFRVRQQLLAEIQSKLARHINRQGILFVE
ncbi:hypothetical protein L0669_06895 [Flavobacterium bizetiae]|uniref:hypothetical protein n=1 Tax=Flavobacterium bizetiae TaxID=2704140 RepID=UPI0021E894E7|nr:hypothetical protein [Flavobacterium bizetiae]UTN05636.1 hypothetical protein L0669_06895 [Flavobacterium bizetiae]